MGGATCRTPPIPRSASYMITTVNEAVSELSQGMTLKAGTIIATGTPGGVAMGMKPPVFLKSGDVVKCVISKIGAGSAPSQVHVAT